MNDSHNANAISEAKPTTTHSQLSGMVLRLELKQKYVPKVTNTLRSLDRVKVK